MTKATLIVASLVLAICSSPAHAESSLTSETSRAQVATLDLARTVFTRYLEAWSGGNTTGESVAALFSDRAQIELPLAGHLEWTITIEGRPAIGEVLDAMNRADTRWTFSDLHFFPTLQAGVVFVQYTGMESSARASDVHYRNLALIEIDGERIVRIRDFNGAALVMKNLNGFSKVATSQSDGTSDR